MISFQQNLFEVRTTNIRENIWVVQGGGSIWGHISGIWANYTPPYIFENRFEGGYS